MRRFPWWGSVLLSIAAYYGLKYGIPKFADLSSSTSEFLALLAPLTAMGFLLLAGKQLYNGVPEQDARAPEDDKTD